MLSIFNPYHFISHYNHHYPPLVHTHLTIIGYQPLAYTKSSSRLPASAAWPAVDSGASQQIPFRAKSLALDQMVNLTSLTLEVERRVVILLSPFCDFACSGG